MAERKHWFRRPGIRVSLMISGLMLALALALLLFWLTTRALFSRNDHFVLRRIQVHGGQWWHGRDAQLAGILELVPGQVNLFALEPAELRRCLQEQPGIRTAAVARRLPDTLEIQLMERIPRAVLHRSGGAWVIDDEAVVLDRHHCLDLGDELPVITGFRPDRELHSGVELPSLLLALEMLQLVRIHYPWMRIRRISLHHPNEIQVNFLVGNDAREFTAYFRRERLERRLERLRQAVTQVVRERDPRREFDLRFENQVILR